MMNPDMMKAAQDMMSKMSPEDMQKMMQMQQEMCVCCRLWGLLLAHVREGPCSRPDAVLFSLLRVCRMKNPSMMQQAQQMMSNPAMAQQAANQMKNMSGDDLKKQMDMASQHLPSLGAGAAGGTAAPAPAVSASARLKASAMAVPDDAVAAVQEAEEAKAAGNAKFKAADYAAAAAKYTEGVTSVETALTKASLTGGDKKAVDELKEACHLNLANCRLKLCEWDLAVKECDKVLSHGENRKARFRRGDALTQLGKLTEARDDLAKAVKMDPSDAVVAGKLKDVQKQLGEDAAPLVEEGDSDDDVEEVTTSGAKAVSASGPSTMPAMPPNMPDPAQMEQMLDQISPEQMQAQLDQMDNLTPEQMRMMGMPANVDKDQLKAMSSMFKGMDKESMKSMAKMAATMRPQMEAMGMAGGSGGGSSSSSVAGSGGGGGGGGSLPAGLPSMDALKNGEMGMDQGLDMLKNMSPDMMKAGMDMMKNMDPAMMKNMSKMMGREIDEKQLEQVQSMMSNMKPEDMEKWANRAQKVAGFAGKPMALYKSIKGIFERIGYVGMLGLLGGLWAIMFVGHMTEAF